MSEEKDYSMVSLSCLNLFYATFYDITKIKEQPEYAARGKGVFTLGSLPPYRAFLHEVVGK